MTRPEICIQNKQMYMYKNDGYVKRYNESFKLKVLAELTKGNYSKRQIALTYGI